MSKLTIKSTKKIIHVEKNKKLLAALSEEGVPVKSSCGGLARCGDCASIITKGEENLNAPTEAEVKLLGDEFSISKKRLTCQTTISGDVEIDILKS